MSNGGTLEQIYEGDSEQHKLSVNCRSGSVPPVKLEYETTCMLDGSAPILLDPLLDAINTVRVHWMDDAKVKRGNFLLKMGVPNLSQVKGSRHERVRGLGHDPSIFRT
jgi:hypothetical protein